MPLDFEDLKGIGIDPALITLTGGDADVQESEDEAVEVCFVPLR